MDEGEGIPWKRRVRDFPPGNLWIRNKSAPLPSPNAATSQISSVIPTAGQEIRVFLDPILEFLRPKQPFPKFPWIWEQSLNPMEKSFFFSVGIPEKTGP